MWDKIETLQPLFTSAVLTAVDADGYPISIRTVPQCDFIAQFIHIAIPSQLPFQAGPAALLFHSHDEKLATLKSFALRGHLAYHATEWIFYPQRFIPGVGINSYQQYIDDATNTARAYLQKRGIEHLEVPWDKIKALHAEKSSS